MSPMELYRAAFRKHIETLKAYKVFMETLEKKGESWSGVLSAALVSEASIDDLSASLGIDQATLSLWVEGTS